MKECCTKTLVEYEKTLGITVSEVLEYQTKLNREFNEKLEKLKPCEHDMCNCDEAKAKWKIDSIEVKDGMSSCGGALLAGTNCGECELCKLELQAVNNGMDAAKEDIPCEEENCYGDANVCKAKKTKPKCECICSPKNLEVKSNCPDCKPKDL